MYRLSIVVALYNTEQYIEECILSFVKQCKNSKLYSLVIVNDGSTDRSMDIVEKYTSHENIYVFNKENGGLSSSRNYGVDFLLDKTEYISFLDADDAIADSYLSEFDEIYQSCKPDLIEFNISRFSKIRSVEIKSSLCLNHVENNSDILLKRIFDKGLWFACARIYSIQLFKEHRFEVGRRYEDMILVPTLYYKAEKIYSSSSALYRYRDNDSGITRNPQIKDIDDIIYSVGNLSNLCQNENLIKSYMSSTQKTAVYVLSNIPISYNVMKTLMFISNKTNVPLIITSTSFIKQKVLSNVKRAIKCILYSAR